MWVLTTDNENYRLYTNTATGSKSEQTKVYTDKDGNSWWAFDNLIALPHTRTMAATKITSLYSLGLSKDDLSGHIGNLKKILKSTDVDKYEKAYAQVLDFETKANSATDAIKQMTSLVCVYYTLNDESIDGWDNDLQIKKMSLLEADPTMHGFFLNRQIDAIQRSTEAYSLISQTVSLPLEEKEI